MGPFLLSSAIVLVSHLSQAGYTPAAFDYAAACSSGQNNGYLFICGNNSCPVYSCQDSTCHPANFAHACDPILTSGSSCSGLTNLGTGPWEAGYYNFVGCNYSSAVPQNCFCNEGMSGTVSCHNDDYGWGTTYDSCGARYIPAETPPPTVTPTYLCGDPNFVCSYDSQCEDYTNSGIKQTCDATGLNCVDESTNQSYNVECREFADPSQNYCGLTTSACPSGYTSFTAIRSGVGVCGCRINVASTSTPTMTPTISATPTITSTITLTVTKTTTVTPTGTTIPKTALISDDIDHIILGTALLFVGIFLFYSGNYLTLGTFIWNKSGLKIISHFNSRAKNVVMSKERKSFENKFKSSANEN